MEEFLNFHAGCLSWLSGLVYLAFLALGDDAEPVLVDEQVAVLERAALRPAPPPEPQHGPRPPRNRINQHDGTRPRKTKMKD